MVAMLNHPFGQLLHIDCFNAQVCSDANACSRKTSRLALCLPQGGFSVTERAVHLRISLDALDHDLIWTAGGWTLRSELQCGVRVS
jgi:hypothetical protein